ncbi:MAG: zf-TFIIB domain-containing protein [Thermoplasmatota archaeon]
MMSKLDLERKIECPLCGQVMSQVIISKHSYSIMVDHCRECGGYWFDSFELDNVLDDVSRREGLPFNNCSVNEAEFRCPRCEGVVETKLLYDIKVDLCLNCGGIWLDKGELGEVQNAYRFYHNTNKMVELMHEALVAN